MTSSSSFHEEESDDFPSTSFWTAKGKEENRKGRGKVWVPSFKPPSGRQLLEFKGPSKLKIRGRVVSLPEPFWWSDALDDESLERKVSKGLQSFYLKTNALYDVVDQKNFHFPMFRTLPTVLVDGKKFHVDFETIKMKITHYASLGKEYGSKEIMEDLKSLRLNLRPVMEKHYRDRGKHMSYKDFKYTLKYLDQLKPIIEEELMVANACKECTINYYEFDNAFSVPCSQKHGVGVARIKKAYQIVKILSSKNNGLVQVALFTPISKHLWKKDEDQGKWIKVCNSESHERKWVNPDNIKRLEEKEDWLMTQQETPQMKLLEDYLLMMAARFGVEEDLETETGDIIPFTSWVKKSGSSRTPDTIVFPWNRVLSLPSSEGSNNCSCGGKRKRDLFMESKREAANRLKRQEKKQEAEDKRQKKKKEQEEMKLERKKKLKKEMEAVKDIPSLDANDERVKDRKCSFIGCKKKRKPESIVYPCPLCDDVFYCDPGCADKAMNSHCSVCSMTKAAPMRVIQDKARGAVSSESLERVIDHCKRICKNYPDITERASQTGDNSLSRTENVNLLMTKYKYNQLPDCSTQEQATQILSEIQEQASQRISQASVTRVDTSIIEEGFSQRTGVKVLSRAFQVDEASFEIDLNFKITPKENLEEFNELKLNDSQGTQVNLSSTDVSSSTETETETDDDLTAEEEFTEEKEEQAEYTRKNKRKYP